MNLKKEAKKDPHNCAGVVTQPTSLFMAASEVLSILIFSVACAVLLGWALDIPVLKSISPDFVSMKPNTALCFVFSGFSLWTLQSKRQDGPLLRRLGLILSWAVFGIGLFTFSEYLFNRDLGIDQFLFKESPGAVLTTHAGRMAINTAINFTLIGLALSLLSSQKKGRSFAAQILLFPVGGISILAFVGYLYKAPPLFLGQHFSTAMALHTSVLFMVVFWGGLFCRPGCGIMTVVSDDGIGGKLIRRLLPITCLVPIIFGWIKLHGEYSGLVSNEFGVSFVAIGNLTVTTAYVLFLSFWLSNVDFKRKKVEETLRKSEQEFRTLAEVVPQIVWVTRADGWNIFFNQRWADYTGLSLEESHGHGWNTPFHPEDKQRAWDAWQRATQHGDVYSLECRLRRADGVYRWWLIRGDSLRDTEGTILKWFGTCTDIEDIKQAEGKIRESEARYKTLVENIPQKIFLKSKDLKIISINKNYAQDLGTHPEDLLGKSDYDLFPKELADKYREDDKRVLESGRTEEMEERYLKDGREVWVQTVKTPVRNEKGEITGILGVFWDITERKKVEDDIKKLNSELEELVKDRTAELSEALRGMEAFSYSVAHDLRTPLRAMTGFASILAEDYAPKLDENGRQLVRDINVHAARMGQLIEDLLTLAHLVRKEMDLADIDMTKLAQDVYDELKAVLFSGKAIEVSIAALPVAWADRTLAKQIFSNLISNAMKFTGSKEKAAIGIGAYEKDGERVYYVKDNGAGFDMQYENKLFGIFQRLHSQDEFTGTGIGLAIVKGAVGRLGGRVWAEGKVGQGATFYFTLSK